MDLISWFLAKIAKTAINLIHAKFLSNVGKKRYTERFKDLRKNKISGKNQEKIQSAHTLNAENETKKKYALQR